jgi:uncharacterized protein YndB with AHSA1/START domain
MAVSDARRQTHIDAPVQVVWDLIADVDHHPEWWPRVIEVHCDGLEEGCEYRQVTQTPFGKDNMHLRVDELDDCEEFLIRCVNTGTFVRLALTEAQGGTFVEGQMGMEPKAIQYRLFDFVAGQRYFRRWLEASLDAMRDVATERARADSGSET